MHFGDLTVFNTARITGCAEETGKVSGFQPGPFAKARLSNPFAVERRRVLNGTGFSWGLWVCWILRSLVLSPRVNRRFFRATLTQRFPVSLGYCHGYRISTRGDRQGLRWFGAKAPLCH